MVGGLDDSTTPEVPGELHLLLTEQHLQKIGDSVMELAWFAPFFRIASMIETNALRCSAVASFAPCRSKAAIAVMTGGSPYTVMRVFASVNRRRLSRRLPSSL